MANKGVRQDQVPALTDQVCEGDSPDHDRAASHTWPCYDTVLAVTPMQYCVNTYQHTLHDGNTHVQSLCDTARQYDQDILLAVAASHPT
jgi:hypothetical protein